jgi:hypothetical protein
MLRARARTSDATAAFAGADGEDKDAGEVSG